VGGEERRVGGEERRVGGEERRVSGEFVASSCLLAYCQIAIQELPSSLSSWVLQTKYFRLLWGNTKFKEPSLRAKF